MNTPRLEIRMFGTMQVLVEGVPTRITEPKTQWLLALLALRLGREVPRSDVISVLWIDRTEVSARRYLTKLLSEKLRSILGAAWPCLMTPGDSLLLNDSAVVDVIEFDVALKGGSRSDLDRAVTLYRAPLLESCNEEWIFPERSRRREAYLDAQECLAQLAIERNELSEAIRHLRLVIAEDRWRESAFTLLMQALYSRGSYSEVVQVYENLKTNLKELETEPDDETYALYKAMRRRQRERKPASSPQVTVSKYQVPVPLTGLIGRTREIKSIERFFQEGRLVTLKGPGGVGKTRLAIAVAEALEEKSAAECVDGIRFVDLTAQPDPQLVLATISKVFGVVEQGGRSLEETLLLSLSDQFLLLILDNCEHVQDTCASVVESLLSRCPGLRILATSRQPLDITGEIDYEVPALDVPPVVGSQAVTHTTCVVHLEDYTATKLFIDRAQRHLPDIPLTAAQERMVAEICRQLDGIPLYIELAAARTSTISVEQIHKGLNDRLRLLKRGRPSLGRHQNARAVIDWSYNLLNEVEKTVLQRLSVFSGGWTLEAAEIVCRDDGLPHGAYREAISAEDVLDILASLLDKSLVHKSELNDQNGVIRYRLLETVKQYSAECLEENGCTELIKTRHQQWLLGVVSEAVTSLVGSSFETYVRRIESEHDNLRMGLTWSTQEGNVEAGLRLTGAMWPFWEAQGYLTEGREQLERVLGMSDAHPEAVLRAPALHGLGVLAFNQADYSTARVAIEESLVLRRNSGDKRSIASSLNSLGNVTRAQGQIETAQILYKESLAIQRDIGDPRGIARALTALGLVAKDLSQYSVAEALYAESMAIYRELADRRGIATISQRLGLIFSLRGDYPVAETFYKESLILFTELEDKSGMAGVRLDQGNNAYYQSNYLEARRLYEESLSISRELGAKREIASALGNKREIATALGNISSVAYYQGDEREAREYCEAGLAIFREIGDTWGIASLLESSGNMALNQDDYETAQKLFEESLNIFEVRKDKRAIAALIGDLGWLADRLGDYKGARTGYERSLGIFRELNDAPGTVSMLEKFASLVWRHNSQAVKQWIIAATLQKKSQIPITPRSQEEERRNLSIAKSILGEEVFAKTWAEGMAMTIDQCIHFVLQEQGNTCQ